MSKQNGTIAPLLFENSYPNTQPPASSVRKNFSKLVDSLAESYRNGKISEKALTELLKHAASVYIESEISERFDRIFSRKSYSNR